jgi:hypothetical protein
MLDYAVWAEVAKVQAADFRKLHDLACHSELDRPEVRCILGQREIGARPVIVREVAGEDAAEMSQDEHVIQALAPDRADEPLGERVLPRCRNGVTAVTGAWVLYTPGQCRRFGRVWA